MTGTEFITYVKAKLNRLDSNAYEDVRPEEVLFFAHEALKSLTLKFDVGQYSQVLDKGALLLYLGDLTVSSGELTLDGNSKVIPVESILKLKDVSVFVTTGTGATLETGWMPTRELSNIKTSERETNPFRKSFADTPVYRIINGKITFDTKDFQCSKVKYDYLKYPAVITESSTLTYTFMSELQNTTVTFILENLDSRRLQSQTVISKS